MQVYKRMRWQPEGKQSSSARSIDQLSWWIESDWSAEGLMAEEVELVEESVGESVEESVREEEEEPRRRPG